MITLDGFSVTVGGHRLLAHLDLDVASGEWLGVIGPNGAGKSTLIRALAGLVGHTGSATVAGRVVAGLGPRELARLVATVAQAPVVPEQMTVGDYVLLGRTAHLGVLQRDGPADHRVVAETMAVLELTDLAGRTMATLSGGERQRVFWARAVAQQTPVLLLDEPTTALDLGHQQELLGLIDRRRRDHGLTVITTLHDLTLAGEYPDRLLLLDGGRVIAHGQPAEVLTPETIAAVYGASVEVWPPDPAAGRRGPVVVPRRPAR